MFYPCQDVPSVSRHMAHSVSGGTSTSGASRQSFTELTGKCTGYQEEMGMFRCCIRVERILIVDHGRIMLILTYNTTIRKNHVPTGCDHY